MESENVTYEFLLPGERPIRRKSRYFRCPIHNNVALGDGSVVQGKGRGGF
jgi:hypothetical protein